MTVAMLMVNTLKAARLTTNPLMPPFRVEDYMHLHADDSHAVDPDRADRYQPIA